MQGFEKKVSNLYLIKMLLYSYNCFGRTLTNGLVANEETLMLIIWNIY